MVVGLFKTPVKQRRTLYYSRPWYGVGWILTGRSRVFIRGNTVFHSPKWLTPICISNPSSVSAYGHHMTPALLMRISNRDSPGTQTQYTIITILNIGVTQLSPVLLATFLCRPPDNKRQTKQEKHFVDISSLENQSSKLRITIWGSDMTKVHLYS